MEIKKVNCWEFKNCGKEPGGINTNGNGACPAATERRLDGINDGNNAGRACWILQNTECIDQENQSYAKKFKNCFYCDFFKQVELEEKDNFLIANKILRHLEM